MITAKVRTRLNVKHVRKKVSQGNRKGLEGAGVIVQRSARKQFSHRTVKSKPTWSKAGEFRGRPVLAMEFRPPKPGRITSWKNPRGRGATRTGFLRTLIEFAVDRRRESVVIGPTNEATWLNKLQEFGGSSQRVLTRIGLYRNERGGRDSRGRFLANKKSGGSILERFPPPASMMSGGRSGGRDSRGRFKANIGRGAYIGVWVDPIHTRRKIYPMATSPGSVKPGRFMAKGLAEKRAKLAEQFRNRISGP